jgi:hypothetical protein
MSKCSNVHRTVAFAGHGLAPDALAHGLHDLAISLWLSSWAAAFVVVSFVALAVLSPTTR